MQRYFAKHDWLSCAYQFNFEYIHTELKASLNASIWYFLRLQSNQATSVRVLLWELNCVHSLGTRNRKCFGYAETNESQATARSCVQNQRRSVWFYENKREKLVLLHVENMKRIHRKIISKWSGNRVAFHEFETYTWPENLPFAVPALKRCVNLFGRVRNFTLVS